MKDNVVLEVKHLKKYFDLGHGRTLHAVDDVSFSVRKGDTTLKDAIDAVLAPMTEQDFNDLIDEAISVQPEI